MAVRFSVDLSDPESYDAFARLEALADLWDLTVRDYDVEMGTSRFTREAALQDSIGQAKTLTAKPVVSVGRFTSPDTMARVIRSGVQDMIGAARPSIADPFLPKKIEEGRIDDIRECIGCNVCYAYDTAGVPIRCTQNPAMGEEHRKGWHPERVPAAAAAERVLVVGAGPAGLEAARALGQRGYQVLLAEAGRELGGRVTRESRLPGLSEWARVRDWRVGQIEKMPNVEVFRESRMGREDIHAVGAAHLLIATGSRWTEDGIGRTRFRPIEIHAKAQVFGVETVLNSEDLPAGHVLIFDDDAHYMGPVLALALRSRGNPVTLVTPSGRVGQWGAHTGEIFASTRALIEADVELITNRVVAAIEPGSATLSCYFSGRQETLPADWVLPVTRREPQDALYFELGKERDAGRTPGLKTLRRIGDCEAPGLIAAAVYSGYKAAMELGQP